MDALCLCRRGQDRVLAFHYRGHGNIATVQLWLMSPCGFISCFYGGCRGISLSKKATLACKHVPATAKEHIERTPEYQSRLTPSSCTCPRHSFRPVNPPSQRPTQAPTARSIFLPVQKLFQATETEQKLRFVNLIQQQPPVSASQMTVNPPTGSHFILKGGIWYPNTDEAACSVTFKAKSGDIGVIDSDLCPMCVKESRKSGRLISADLLFSYYGLGTGYVQLTLATRRCTQKACGFIEPFDSRTIHSVPAGPRLVIGDDFGFFFNSSRFETNCSDREIASLAKAVTVSQLRVSFICPFLPVLFIFFLSKFRLEAGKNDQLFFDQVHPKLLKSLDPRLMTVWVMQWLKFAKPNEIIDPQCTSSVFSFLVSSFFF